MDSAANNVSLRKYMYMSFEKPKVEVRPPPADDVVEDTQLHHEQRHVGGTYIPVKKRPAKIVD